MPSKRSFEPLDSVSAIPQCGTESICSFPLLAEMGWGPVELLEGFLQQPTQLSQISS
jgi:hypothetical protein